MRHSAITTSRLVMAVWEISIIALNNKSVLHLQAKEYGCNCENNESCLLRNKYLIAMVIIRKITSTCLFRVYNKISLHEQ